MSSQGDTNRAQVQAYVVVDGPGHQNTRLTIKEGITSLGRLPSNDLILLGDLVSRNHARILYFNGKAAVQDMDSHNGCWVNGEKVSKHAIDNQDMVRVGNFLLTFVLDEVREASQSASHKIPAESSETDTDPVPLPRRATKTSQEALSAEDLILPKGLDYRHPDESVDLADFGADRISTHSQLRNHSLLLAMLKASEAFTTSRNRSEYCQKVVHLLVNELRLSACGFYEIENEETPALICSAGPATHHGGQLCASRSVLRWATSKRHTIYSKDISNDIRFSDTESVVNALHNVRALVCAPILTSETCLGALYVSRNAEDLFCDREIDVIEAIASLFASGLQNFSYLSEKTAHGATSEPKQFADVEHNLEDSSDRHLMNVNLSSVCAVNVVGLSAATEMADSRELGRFLGLYQNRVSEHIADCSGILSKRQGGQITAIFCTPNSEEEDAYKAIEAARRIKKSFSELQREFPVFAMLGINLGLSTGKILLGNLEQSSRGEYTAIGRAVDTAERLRDSGTIGTIVLSKEIRNIVGANIQVEKLKPCPLRTEPDGIERFSLNE